MTLEMRTDLGIAAAGCCSAWGFKCRNLSVFSWLSDFDQILRQLCEKFV